MAELNPYFIYNGVSSASYGVKCTKFAMPIAPTMSVVNEDIPGAYGNYFEGINYTSKSFTFKVYLDTNGSRERMQEITDQMAEYLILYDEDKEWSTLMQMVAAGILKPEIAIAWKYDLPWDKPEDLAAIREKYMPEQTEPSQEDE